MKKYLLLILMVVSTSGCTILSYQKCSKVKGHPEEKVEMTFERISTVEHNGCTLKIHYRPHRDKSLLIGPIIPIIPTFGRMAYDLGSGERWIKVVNDGDAKTVKIKQVAVKKTILDCPVSIHSYGDGQKYKFTEAPLNLLELESKEVLWINLPKKETVTILIEVSSEVKAIKVKEVLRFNYHMVTV